MHSFSAVTSRQLLLCVCIFTSCIEEKLQAIGSPHLLSLETGSGSRSLKTGGS